MVDSAKSSATKILRTKQSPPVRLPEPFYGRLRASAAMHMRSIPKQLEYMVDIAESVSDQLSREELLNVQSGLSRIVVEKIDAPRVDKKTLFGSLETMRNTGTLSQAVTDTDIKYQASPSHPSYLERINSDGSRDIGMFNKGKFKVAKDLR